MEKRLEPGSVIKGVRVERIVRTDSAYRLQLSTGEVWGADGIIVTTPHHVVPDMFADYPFFAPFRSVPLTSVATVALAFPEEAIRQDIDGTGFVVSRRSDYTMTACTWTHKKLAAHGAAWQGALALLRRAPGR